MSGCSQEEVETKRMARTMAGLLLLGASRDGNVARTGYIIRWFFTCGEAPDGDYTMARCVRRIWMEGDSLNESDARAFIR